MSYLIKDMPDEEKPRERAKKYGFETLSVVDLLSILLRTGTRNKSVKELAMEISKYLDSLPNITDLRLSSLSNFKGVGEVKAITLLSAIELGKRMGYKKVFKKNIINNDKDVFDYFEIFFKYETQEKMLAIFLNSKNEILESKIIFTGTANQSLVHVRDIYKEGILVNAIKIICLHNHPSGNPNPSKEDEYTTKRLKEAGQIIGIPLVDHIIIGDNKYYSFLENDVL